MNIPFFADLSSVESEPKNQTVVRLTSSTWSDKRGIHLKKSLIFLKRHCIGYNILEEDISAIGIADVILRLINLHECEDGIYQVVICNEKRDWESSYIDDYDFKLIPYSITRSE